MTLDDVITDVVHGDDNVAHTDEDLDAMFALVYDRQPDDKDREDGLWSLICSGVSKGDCICDQCCGG